MKPPGLPVRPAHRGREGVHIRGPVGICLCPWCGCQSPLPPSSFPLFLVPHPAPGSISISAVPPADPGCPCSATAGCPEEARTVGVQGPLTCWGRVAQGGDRATHTWSPQRRNCQGPCPPRTALESHSLTLRVQQGPDLTDFVRPPAHWRWLQMQAAGGLRW